MKYLQERASAINPLDDFNELLKSRCNILKRIIYLYNLHQTVLDMTGETTSMWNRPELFISGGLLGANFSQLATGSDQLGADFGQPAPNFGQLKAF